MRGLRGNLGVVSPATFKISYVTWFCVLSSQILVWVTNPSPLGLVTVNHVTSILDLQMPPGCLSVHLLLVGVLCLRERYVALYIALVPPNAFI